MAVDGGRESDQRHRPEVWKIRHGHDAEPADGEVHFGIEIVRELWHDVSARGRRRCS